MLQVDPLVTAGSNYCTSDDSNNCTGATGIPRCRLVMQEVHIVIQQHQDGGTTLMVNGHLVMGDRGAKVLKLDHARTSRCSSHINAYTYNHQVVTAW